jgi:hypothetical protein
MFDDSRRSVGLALLLCVCVATHGRADGRFGEAHLEKNRRLNVSERRFSSIGWRC